MTAERISWWLACQVHKCVRPYEMSLPTARNQQRGSVAGVHGNKNSRVKERNGIDFRV